VVDVGDDGDISHPVVCQCCGHVSCLPTKQAEPPFDSASKIG
jgi:hypothetical protein